MPVLTNVVGTPTTPKYAEVVWRGTDSVTGEGNRKFYQVWHFRRTNLTYATEDQAALATKFQEDMDAAMNAALSNDYVGGSVTGRYMDDPTNNDGQGATAGNGTVTGDRLPNWNAVTIQLKTDGRGRNYRGSKHFGPVAESQTLEEFLTGAGITVWTAVKTVLDDASYAFETPAGNIWQLIVLSTTLSDLVSNPSVFTSADVTSTKINLRVGSMLRRKKVGNT